MIAETELPEASVTVEILGLYFCSTLGVNPAAEAGIVISAASTMADKKAATFFIMNLPFKFSLIYLFHALSENQIPSLWVALHAGGQD